MLLIVPCGNDPAAETAMRNSQAGKDIETLIMIVVAIMLLGLFWQARNNSRRSQEEATAAKLDGGYPFEKMPPE